MRTRWQRLLICIVAVAFLLGVCTELGLVRLPQGKMPQGLLAVGTRIMQVLRTHLDWAVLLEGIRGLGSYTSRLNWGDVLNRFILPAPPAPQLLQFRMQ